MKPQTPERLDSARKGAVAVWGDDRVQQLVLMVGALVLVAALGRISEPLHPRPQFYETVAQIMPVVLLLAAVEGRFFRPRPGHGRVERFTLRAVWLASLAGLGAALFIVATGQDPSFLRGLVLFSLIVLGSLATIYAIEGPLDDGSD